MSCRQFSSMAGTYIFSQYWTRSKKKINDRRNSTAQRKCRISNSVGNYSILMAINQDVTDHHNRVLKSSWLPFPDFLVSHHMLEFLGVLLSCLTHLTYHILLYLALLINISIVIQCVQANMINIYIALFGIMTMDVSL